MTQPATTDATAKRTHHLDKRARALAQQGPGAADELLNTRSLADWLGVSELWLELGRARNYGPKFVKLGPRMVRYRRADVLAWLDARANASKAAR